MNVRGKISRRKKFARKKQFYMLEYSCVFLELETEWQNIKDDFRHGRMRKKNTLWARIEYFKEALSSFDKKVVRILLLFYWLSQISVKTLSDLELIKGDADAFDVIFVRVQNHAPLELLDDAPPSTSPSSSSSLFSNGRHEASESNTSTANAKIPKKIIPAVAVALYKVRICHDEKPIIFVNLCQFQHKCLQKGIGTRYPGRADRQSALFRWMITQIFCHKDRALDITMEQFDILIRSFR